jgi:hypothetical protein
MAWSWLITLITYGLAARGLARGIRRRDVLTVLWAASAAALLLSVAGYQANARFRVPAIPFVVLLAAASAGPRDQRVAGSLSVPHGPTSV